MKKTFFGVCKQCFSIKKFENIQPVRESSENMRVYVCDDCIIKSIDPRLKEKTDFQTFQPSLF